MFNSITNWYLFHGWCMWASWTAFSFIMIFSNRYLKGYLWKQRLNIHRVTGVIIMIITVVICGYTWGVKFDYEFENNYHSYFVFPVLFLISFLTFGGIYSKDLMDRTKWNTKQVLMIKMGHQIFAYLIILSANLGVAFGIYNYRKNNRHKSDFPLEWLNAAFSISILLLAEILF